jgi:hypothetical protein
MMRFWRRPASGLAALCVALLASGCTMAVAGVAAPARDSAGIIGIGRSIDQLLPTGAELSQVLKVRVRESEFPPSVGGLDALSGWMPSGTDPQCAAVVYPFLKEPYRGSTARAAAEQHWSPIPGNFAVKAGAVALASPRDARSLFARFVSQWQGCQGKTEMFRHSPDETAIPDYLNLITDEKNTGAMLTAVVVLSTPDDPSPLPSERAVGVAYNCILEVGVTEIGREEGKPVTAAHAQDIVKLMMAKAGA